MKLRSGTIITVPGENRPRTVGWPGWGVHCTQLTQNQGPDPNMNRGWGAPRIEPPPTHGGWGTRPTGGWGTGGWGTRPATLQDGEGWGIKSTPKAVP